jgi:Icc-related predicted phosphoesterase
MIIDCISDLHGHYPELEGGDLLIVAGDLTTTCALPFQMKFNSWLYEQSKKYRKSIVIAGNHDNNLINLPPDNLYFSTWNSITGKQESYAEYLCDSGTEFEYEEPVRNLFDEKDKSLVYRKKLKIWGSPWTKTFDGMNPHCKAFTCDTEEQLAEKWALIPDDVDILITHSPAACILDRNDRGEYCGSPSLLIRATSLPNLKLFVFGHIHEGYGQYRAEELIEFSENYMTMKIFGPPKCKSMPHIVNASHVNERYEPVNKPIRIII